jgi:hypothetical protein
MRKKFLLLDCHPELVSWSAVKNGNGCSQGFAVPLNPTPYFLKSVACARQIITTLKAAESIRERFLKQIQNSRQ